MTQRSALQQLEPNMNIKGVPVVISILLTILVIVPRSSAQSAPGVFADANNPAGAPDPEKMDDIWNVDPISGQVSITIPFATTPVGGRGPRIPFKLLYNSGSTITLQESGNYSTGLQDLGYSGGSSLVTRLQWTPYPVSTNLTAPVGPWVTSGPTFTSYSSSIPDSGENPLTGQYSELGCTIGGPYNYTDESGNTHDTLLEEYQPSSANPAPGAGLNPVCGSARSEAAWPNSSTSDGSAMLASDGTVTYPDGTVFTGTQFGSSGYPVHKLRDPNGNTAAVTISGAIATATDALNRTVFVTNIPVWQAGQIPAGSYYVNTPSSTSTTGLSYGVTVSTTRIQAFTMPHPSSYEELDCYGGCSAQSTIEQTLGTYTYPAVTEISLPDGASSYGFTYDSTYGTICKVIFPTGGYVRFDWQIRPYSWTPYGQFLAVSDIVVKDVYTSASNGTNSCSPDGDESQWIYDLVTHDPATSGSIPSNVYSTVTAPDNSYTKYSYVSNSGSQYGNACFDHSMPVLGSLPRFSCKEASRSIYATSSSSSPLKTVARNFDSQGNTLQEATALYDGPIPLQQVTQYLYDQWENVVEKDESDYYNCGSTPCQFPVQGISLTVPSANWLRKTYTIYAYTTNSALATAHIVNAPSQVLVTDRSGNPYSLTGYTYDGNGNLLTEQKCLSISGTGSGATCSSAWETKYSYDTTGQVTQKIEGYGTAVAATTSYAWGGQGNGYLYTVTHPNSATDAYTYFESTTGQIETHKDWNHNQTTYDYTDPLNRIHTITAPATIDGTTGNSGQGVSTYTYTDTPGDYSVQEQHSLTAGVATSVTKYYDGLGRIEKSSTLVPISQCSSGAIQATTTYDVMMRTYQVSNPYCTTADLTYGLTTFLYDPLGRKTQITNADGTVSSIGYGGNATKFTDPSNGTVTPQHIQQQNGLGQLTNVCEVTASTFGSVAPAACNLNLSGTGYLTAYSYDPLNNLVAVGQLGVSRSFIYDSLSRLTSAVNPETGAVSYGYLTTASAPCSPNSALPCKKTDARGVAISYNYDNLGRLISKTYNDSATPIACYQYDAGAGSNPIGHLTNAWTQPASTGTCLSSPTSFINLKSYLNYDAVGRLLNATQRMCVRGSCSGPTAYQISTSYDLAGNTTTLSNSVGANDQPLTLANHFDVASRPCLSTSSWTTNASPNIFQINSSSPGYSPAGGLQNYYLGSTASNTLSSCATTPTSPVNVVLGYNKRFWVSSISATGQIP
jgi:YD repeat-containing protein